MIKLIASLMIGLVLFTPNLAYAQNLCEEDPGTYGQTEFCRNQSDDASNNPILGTINTVINLFTFIGSVGAVIMVIIGGFKYVTSSGDPQSTGSARNTIIYSLVGLVVIILARFIVLFVLDRIG